MNADDLAIAVFNLEAGGWNPHHEDYRNLDRLPEMIGQLPGGVDVLLLQEGKYYTERGQRLRYRAERLLAPFGLRSFMTTSATGPMHNLVFARWPRLQPLEHHKPEQPDVFADKIGWLHFQADGLPAPLAVRSEHWPHTGGDARQHAARTLTRFAAPGLLSLIGGDLNELWPDCPGHAEYEPDWHKLAPHKRAHKTLPPGLRPAGPPVSDRRATQVLREAGYVNAGCMAGDMTPTVNARADRGQGARIDHIVVSPDLAPALVPESYRVCVSGLGDQLSDHRMISVRLDLDRL